MLLPPTRACNVFDRLQSVQMMMRHRCAIGAAMLVCLAFTSSALAQTTGGLSGTAVDQQGGVLPGVTITAVHQPTGTEYTATTDAEGRFQIPNVRVGGPYQVTAALSGFNDLVQSDVSAGGLLQGRGGERGERWLKRRERVKGGRVIPF